MAWLALVLLGWAGAGSAQQVHYALAHDPGAAGGACWIVEVTVAELAPGSGPLTFALPDWGGWQGVAAYPELLLAEPAAQHDEAARGVFVVRPPERGGAVRLRYRVPLLLLHDEVQRAHGLLPAAGERYAFGWSKPVLVQVSDAGGPLPGARTLELSAPEGTPIVTGWGGRSTGPQRVSLDPALGNGPLAFGEPASATLATRDGFSVEVYQYGDGSRLDDVVAGTLLAASPALGRLFGRPAPTPYRALITDHSQGGMGSPHGLFVSHTAHDAPERREEPWLFAFVLHEHVHHWLGITVGDEGEALVWFKEGFTEYLSLWAAAATGLVPREWFAQRLLELEEIARTRSALGTVPFGDPDVRWRDGDGPLETLAYTGAPLLALLCDVELREDGGPGLPALVAHLLHEGPRTIGLHDLRDAFAAVGLQQRWRRSVQGTELPPVADLLVRAGMQRRALPADLTYLGLQTDGAGPGARVIAVDRDGPAEAAGVHVGDVLTGYFPVRSDPVDASGHRTRYDFGLGLFVPGQAGAFLGIRRGENDHKLDIVPTVLPGAGRQHGWDASGERLRAFFALRR